MIENPIEWPNGARCAVAFTFDMDAESLLHIYLGDTARLPYGTKSAASVLRYARQASAHLTDRGV